MHIVEGFVESGCCLLEVAVDCVFYDANGVVRAMVEVDAHFIVNVICDVVVGVLGDDMIAGRS